MGAARLSNVPGRRIRGACIKRHRHGESGGDKRKLVLAAVFALLIPYVAIGQTLLYYDLEARGETVPARSWRERLLRRPATAEA